jgi:hypothetical protein
MLPDIAFFVALERRVWQALADGDIEADTDLLDPQFLGVYASGFASRGDHAAQLADGPSVADFSIHEARLLPFASNAVMLSYRASFTRPGKANVGSVQSMFVSSIWRQRGATWLNVFSQDTLVTEATP